MGPLSHKLTGRCNLSFIMYDGSSLATCNQYQRVYLRCVLALNLEIYKNIHTINNIDFVHVKIQSFKDIERTNKMYENA